MPQKPESMPKLVAVIDTLLSKLALEPNAKKRHEVSEQIATNLIARGLWGEGIPQEPEEMLKFVLDEMRTLYNFGADKPKS